MSNRFLTKSRFKVGYECPTKLFYLDDKSYGSTKTDNSFLEALAEGGFQVGELAKLYHPGGTEITALDKEEAARQTAELLKQKNVTIYEAAIKFENLFIKVDVLIKTGNSVELIEVKAKSFDPQEENAFYNKRSLKSGNPKLNSEWEPYLVDVAFQTYVFKKAYPDIGVNSFLMLADKSAVATVDGLNQRFFLERTSNGQTRVKIASGTTSASLGEPILKKVNVDDEVGTVWGMTFDEDKSFDAMVAYLSKVCSDKLFHKPTVGSHCKSCEFRIGKDLKADGLKSGFETCWSKARGLRSEDFEKPFVFDVWNFRKSAKLLEAGKVFMAEISEEDVGPQENPDEEGLSSSQRQWIQIQKVQDRSREPYLDVAGLKREMSSWSFPLHFIDFETTMAAIPFHKSRRPYEQIAFQFSHHRIDKNGNITHETQYLNRTKGHFPNFDFVRALMTALSKDHGTIFRYAAHENTVLCQIREQLLSVDEAIVPDRADLIKFIETVTESTGNAEKSWKGQRSMVDMCELVKKYFYHPLTNGSNSIKKVLPAVLNESKELQERYSKPNYGTHELPSLNYSKWTWMKKGQDGQIMDPYKLLPPIFTDLDLEEMDSLITDGSIADGGAAMTAYARMQFTEMSEAECDRVAAALLKYCELDTFAMVMIYEYWKHAVGSKLKKKSVA